MIVKMIGESKRGRLWLSLERLKRKKAD